jgi:glycosyltransferase involved in cell wall biosynthesis
MNRRKKRPVSETKKKKGPSHDRIRSIAWEIGKHYPAPLTQDYAALSMVYPRRGCVHWHVSEKTLKVLQKSHAPVLNNAQIVVRVYDVTDLIFDGSNAHMFFDLDVGNSAGIYYFDNDRLARNYIAEAGLRGRDGSFHPAARSGTAYFDRDRPSGNYHTGGLFVGGMLKRTFPVESVFDAPVYERMNRELAGIERDAPLSIAVIYAGMRSGTVKDPLEIFIRSCAQGYKKFGGRAMLFTPQGKEVIPAESNTLIQSVRSASQSMTARVEKAHKENPFHLIHSHDWYSSQAGLAASKTLKCPVVLTLHSTEYERAQGSEMGRLSTRICSLEKKAVRGAHLIIVPHSSTRQQVINLYGAAPEKVVIIPDVLSGPAPKAADRVSGARHSFGFPPDAPVVLFAGEMSHAAGADLLLESLPTVCRNHRSAHFVFSGDGPLRGELEARAHHAGIGHRCRFIGHVHGKVFESVLMAADFVVIPARTWQDEGLAQMAIQSGRPVLTTHQAGINCVVHGETGLVTFDNPGSITWGLQEMLNNPMKDSMLRIAARRSAGDFPSLETIAARHYMHYEILLKHLAGRKHA